MKRTRRLRWALVLPAGVGAWYGVLIAGILVHGVVGEPIESEPSPARLHVPDAVLFPGFAALSAVAVVCAAAAVAPSHRRSVAWAAWGAGACFAGFFALEALTERDHLGAGSAALAIAAGALAAALWSGGSPRASR